MPVRCKLTPLQRAASLPAVCRYRLSEFPEFKRHDSLSHLKPTGCLTLHGYKGTNSSVFHVLRHPETLYFKINYLAHDICIIWRQPNTRHIFPVISFLRVCEPGYSLFVTPTSFIYPAIILHCGKKRIFRG